MEVYTGHKKYKGMKETSCDLIDIFRPCYVPIELWIPCISLAEYYGQW